jgi:hypothetical protein
MAAPQPEVFAELDGERPALVPPGTYELKFLHHETCVMFGRAPKLACWFTVITMGEHFGVKLARFYNVRRIIGRPARNGRFKAGWKCNFVREYGRLFRLPSRLDRIAMSEFTRHVILGKVRTVTHGSDQAQIPDGLQYSVIEELTGTKIS